MYSPTKTTFHLEFLLPTVCQLINWGYVSLSLNLGGENGTWFTYTFHGKHDFNYLIPIKYGVCSCNFLIFTDDKKKRFSLLKTGSRAIPLPAQSQNILTNTKPKGPSLFKRLLQRDMRRLKCELDVDVIHRQDMKPENLLMQLYFQHGMLGVIRLKLKASMVSLS